MKMNHLLKISVLITAIAISSCSSDDVAVADFDAKGDVYITSILRGEDTLFAPVYKVYANAKILKAQVAIQNDDSEALLLDSHNNSNTDYILEPTEDQFIKDKPSNLTYEFEVISITNDTIRVSDEIGKVGLYPVELSDFKYTEKTHKIELTWTKLDNADKYYISILEEKDGSAVFLSGYIDETEYSFSETSAGWAYGVQFEEGKEYFIRIDAYKFEDSSYPSSLDIDMKSTIYRTIKW